MTDSSRSTGPTDASGLAAKTRSRYLILGAILGVLWYVNGDRPLWEHALRMFVIMLVVLVGLELLARRRYRGEERPRIAHGWIVTAKLVLLAVAVGGELLLEQWTSRADLIVAIGLAAIVAIAGPRLQHYIIQAPGKR